MLVSDAVFYVLSYAAMRLRLPRISRRATYQVCLAVCTSAERFNATSPCATWTTFSLMRCRKRRVEGALPHDSDCHTDVVVAN